MAIVSKPDEELIELTDISYIRRNIPMYLIFSLAKKLRLVRKTKSIDVFEAKELLDNDELFILDIRSADSYERGHIEGSINIEGYFFIKNEKNVLPKDKTMAVMCYGGGLSEAMTHRLRRWGFKNAVNLEGGIEKWAIEIDQTLLDSVW